MDKIILAFNLNFCLLLWGLNYSCCLIYKLIFHSKIFVIWRYPSHGPKKPRQVLESVVLESVDDSSLDIARNFVYDTFGCGWTSSNTQPKYWCQILPSLGQAKNLKYWFFFFFFRCINQWSKNPLIWLADTILANNPQPRFIPRYGICIAT